MPQDVKSHKKLKMIFGILFMCALTTLLFQNCGQVRIAREEKIAFTKPFAGSFCADASYYMSSFYAVNLNGRFENGRFVADSDMDGVSDADEITNKTSPTNRRSNGLVLDQICRLVGGADRCLQLASSCTVASNLLGLSDCDVKVLELDRVGAAHPDKGVDTDRDGVVDIVEILMNTSANLADTTADPDGDNVTNEFELIRGSEVDFPDAGLVSAQTVNVQPAALDGCPTSGWEFTVSNLRIVPGLAYSDPTNTDMNHSATENVFLVYYKLLPLNPSSNNAQIWGKYLRVPYSTTPPDIRLQPSDFKLLGTVAP